MARFATSRHLWLSASAQRRRRLRAALAPVAGPPLGRKTAGQPIAARWLMWPHGRNACHGMAATL